MPAQSDVEHLLRRTEYVARPARVAELVAMPSLAAAVDDILATPANPGAATLTATDNQQRGFQLTHYWFDRMAFDSPRPIQEKMGFFWHGHFCSDITKSGSTDVIRQQIDLFRRDGLTNLRSLTISMSTQVAMLRYLDNYRNKQSSPNQNFARELMELFLLGVGNYTEADVEASTAAWTGHFVDEQLRYQWHPEWHDGTPKSFLGRTINRAGTTATRHGYETIETILGAGVVPTGARIVANRGRPTREVAAEFISRKLWAEFAGSEPSAAVIASLRDTALANDFELRPWVRKLLLLPAFYDTPARQGRVRTPVEFRVAAMVAAGARSADIERLTLLDGMGQRPFFPPDVSGWKHNTYWISPSAMASRMELARTVGVRSRAGFQSGDGLVHLGGGTISKTQIVETWRDQPQRVVDRMLELMDVTLSTTTYQALLAHCERLQPGQRASVVDVILAAPDFHLA